jgi:hypothetical protein
MSLVPIRLARPLPRWLLALGSVLIIGHLAALFLLALSPASGPWTTSFGTGMAQPPAFARQLGSFTTDRYLGPLKMTHNYHFITNRPAVPGVFFEVRLRDEKGYPLQTVSFPQKDAPFAVRHRQILLARGLADDQPVEPRGSEVIPAPNQRVQTVDIWDGAGEWSLVIRSVPEHLVPRDRPVMQPSPWSRVLARSYVRYLCRQHGAASGELIRHTREPLSPLLANGEEPPASAFAELASNFGETKR